ncbi:hypothetical protein QVD17_22527 [Tagetes erecta]|uniref:Uncharacterized protein n=1 Tax=Tagetes erecta TaxID=13708 RepID=A0AAD8NTM8_TARER|nr:hypothetical protein QVD17_22527 [Tagetes erecta]
MTELEFHITKKWKEKGKLLRSIILNNKLFRFKFKLFTAAADHDHKVHNNADHAQAHACIEEIGNKPVSSVFCKPGLMLPSLVRVPSSGFKKIGRVVSMRKHQGKLEDEGGSLELCKKRIMMGKKCRPLNVSGVLRYDNNGVLQPEDLLFSPLNHSF